MNLAETRIWLLVEDDENDVILLKRALARTDPHAQCYWVRDGLEARSYLLGTDKFSDRTQFPFPSIILSDLKMPICSGIELVIWIRQDARFRLVPFIVFSSSDQPSDVARAYQAGANWYLAKPSNFSKLVELLARLTENLATSVWAVT